MSKMTENYNLIMPELTDSPPDITVMNPNWQKIDTKLKEQDENNVEVKNLISSLEESAYILTRDVPSLPIGADFNDYKTPGIWYSYSGIETATFLNCPINLGGGKLIVEFTAGTSCLRQTWIANRATANVYQRNRIANTGEYQAWYEIAQLGDVLPVTPAKITPAAGMDANNFEMGKMYCTTNAEQSNSISNRPDGVISSSTMFVLPSNADNNAHYCVQFWIARFPCRVFMRYKDGTVNGYGSWIETITENHMRSGAGSPEGIVTAPVGTLYRNTSGGANTTLYVKTSGTGNTGWTAK